MSIALLTLRTRACQVVMVGLVTLLWSQPGCNRQASVTVTGAVLRSGQPLAVSPTGVLQVTLKPDVGDNEQFTPKTAECDKATGKFEIPDVRPGKYKVGVQQLDPSPQVDKLNGAFLVDKSKIIRDIDGKTPLDIDLAKPDSGK